MRENADQNNSEYGHFSTVCFVNVAESFATYKALPSVLTSMLAHTTKVELDIPNLLPSAFVSPV